MAPGIIRPQNNSLKPMELSSVDVGYIGLDVFIHSNGKKGLLFFLPCIWHLKFLDEEKQRCPLVSYSLLEKQ